MSAPVTGDQPRDRSTQPGCRIGLPVGSQIPGPTELQRATRAVPGCGYSVVRSGSGSSGGKCRSRICAQRYRTTMPVVSACAWTSSLRASTKG